MLHYLSIPKHPDVFVNDVMQFYSASFLGDMTELLHMLLVDIQKLICMLLVGLWEETFLFVI